MRKANLIPQKIVELATLKRMISVWRLRGQSIAFTNGVFDILHEGHIFSLSQAAAEADILILALNSDSSVKSLNKGPDRPINNQQARALLTASLEIVDAVIIFDEETPLELVRELMPDVMVKGGDYTVEQIAGAKEVIANGGKVVINPLIAGVSTTAMIDKIRKNG